MDRAVTAGESDRIIGLRERYESDFPSLNSSGCLSVDACARALALPAASASLSSCAFPFVSTAVVAHARSTPMQVAHNSGGTGVLLPVQKATSYCLGNSWSDTVRLQVPRRRRCSNGGVSGPAEDLRPVSEVESGVNFGRPAGYGGRLQVHFPGGNQALVPGQTREVWSHLPSTRRFLILCLCRLDQARESGN